MSIINPSRGRGDIAYVGIRGELANRWLERSCLGRHLRCAITVPTVASNRDVQMVMAKINYKFKSGISDAGATTSRGYTREPSEDEDLTQKSQNPIADLVSVPFQSNTNFNAGPFNRTQEVFNIMALTLPDAFAGLQVRNNLALAKNLIYFSFMTLTSVGYGDITPLHPFARSLANIEAIIGQLYPATLLARLVTLELEHRRTS